MANSSAAMKYFTAGLAIALCFMVNFVAADNSSCSNENSKDSCRNKTEALRLRIGALASILVAGTIGVCLPVVGRNFPALSPDRNIFFVIKAFAAGVILATGFVHVLPDAVAFLTSECLNPNPWGNFPFAGFIAMMAAVCTLMVDALATGYYERFHFRNQNKVNQVNEGTDLGNGNGLEHENHVHTHSHATHGHAHGSNTIEEDSTIRHRVIAQVLELGIVAHSVIIGISLGASESPCTIRPLMAALSFHQFFEGMGLGGCIVQAGFKNKSAAVILMTFFFAVTTPFGIALGIGISSAYNENSPTALIVEGVFNAASSGILIYMALVDLLAADFINSSRMKQNGTLQLCSYVALLLGIGSMSLIAKWA